MNILLTGGAGFIGSHTAVALLEAGHSVVALDNLYNSSKESLKRVEKITGKSAPLVIGDAACKDDVKKVFDSYGPIDAVIHFAGLKAVGESVRIPLRYYQNNLDTTFTLLEVMKEYGCTNFVFSSSATVYGTNQQMPLREDFPTGCTNPYGWSKWMNERVLMDCAAADDSLSVVLLRYFNPVGAHPSGLIGEDPTGIPNNLMPFITQVAAGKLDHLNVFGNDYPTHDGTGVRDYIHVCDLASGHVAASEYAAAHKGCEIINLGTGEGYSVLDLKNTFEKVNGLTIPFEIAPRRPGDIATCYADATRAKELLGWKAEKTLDDMCRDSWNWQKNNPNGYGDK